MLADPTGHLSRALGVHIEEGLAYRGTFLVDPAGLIKIAEVQDNGIGRNAEELLRKVKAAQYTASHPGEVCPAKWQPGDKNVKPGLDLVGKNLTYSGEAECKQTENRRSFMLDSAMKEQLITVFAKLENSVELIISDSSHADQTDLLSMLNDVGLDIG